MGNACVGCSITRSKSGFFRSVSPAMQRTQMPNDTVSPRTKGEKVNVLALNQPLPAKNKPPEQVTIPKPDTKTEPVLQPTRAEKNPHKERVASAGLSAEVLKTISPAMQRTQMPDDTVSPRTKGEKVNVLALNQPLPAKNKPPEQVTIPKPDTKTEPVLQPTRAEKNPHKERVASAGLCAEVLKTKTGNLKEFFSLGKKLGQGQFGTTFLCVEKATGEEYACKTIAKWKLKTDEDVENVRREIQIMHHLKGHPNVISMKGAYEDKMAVHIVMELCAGGELFDRIIKCGHYTERKAAALTRTIVGVVEACHSLGVMHRDLKPENFLFVNNQEDSLLKTIDFGLSIFFKPGEEFSYVVGSPYYVAPEVLQQRYGPEADVWSAGVILYILLCGMPPFWDVSKQGIFKQVLDGNLDFSSDPWPSISDSAKDLVKSMLVRDPRRRLTAKEVLRHPWFQVDGVADLDKPLDCAVLSRLEQFSSPNKLWKMALRDSQDLQKSFSTVISL